MFPTNKIKILDGRTGNLIADTSAGARVISIVDTKKLIRLASKAKTEQDFRQLGEAVVDIINTQDSRPTQYTNE